MSVQFVIKHGNVDGVDYNNDGVIDDQDVIVVKLVDGQEVERHLLNKTTQNVIANVIQKSPPTNEVRMVYNHMPPSTMANPPPVVVKDDTSFGQYIKAGAGITVGEVAVKGIFAILASLFTSDGGARRGKKAVTKSVKKRGKTDP